MDADPRTNVVVFQLNNDANDIVTGRAPTLADDGIRQAWEGVGDGREVRREDVVALHSEWEPSPADASYIKATFPQAAAVTFNFSRPGPDGWAEAFASARTTTVDAAAEEVASALATNGENRPTGTGEHHSVGARSRGQAAGQVHHLTDVSGRTPASNQEPHPTSGSERQPATGRDHQPTADSGHQPTDGHQPTGDGEHAPTGSEEHQPTDDPEPPPTTGRDHRPTGHGEHQPTGDSGHRYAANNQDHQPDSAERQPTTTQEHQPSGGSSHQLNGNSEHHPTASQEPQPTDVAERQPTTAQEHQPASGSSHQSTGNGEHHPTTSHEPQPADGAEHRPATAQERESASGSSRQPKDHSEHHPTTSHEPQPADGAERQPATPQERRPSGDSGQQPATSHQPQPTDGTERQPATPQERKPSGDSGQQPASGEESLAGSGELQSAGDSAGDSDSAAAGGGELLPMLWSESSPRVGLLQAVPHWPVAGGRLHLALAVVAPTPRGTVGMYHVTYHQLGGLSFDALMAEACLKLAGGLQVGALQTDEGQLLSLSGSLVAAMVCLPHFYRQLSELVGAERLAVGLPCADDVYVTSAGSPLVDVVHRMVHESEHPATELVPSVLSIVGDHIEVVSERG